MKVTVWADCGYVGAMRKAELEFDDDVSDDDIEEEVRDWFFEHNSYGWERLPTEKQDDGK